MAQHGREDRKGERRLTPRERRDLDVEIGFLEGLTRRDPTYVEALQVLGDNYTSRGRFLDGLRVDEKLLRLCPADPMVYYNLACSYSLVQQPEQAVAALARALDLGYRDFRWMSRDPDLRNARKHPAFRQIRARIRAMAVKT